MPIINIFHGSFCRQDEVIRAFKAKYPFEFLDEQDLLAMTARRQDIAPTELERTLLPGHGPRFFLAVDRKRHLAAVKAVLAESLQENMLCVGRFGHLIPRSIGHVLHVLLIAETRYRVGRAADVLGIPMAMARVRISNDDKDAMEWTEELLHREPWDPLLYDVVLPMDKKGVEHAVETMSACAAKDVLHPTLQSRRAVENFRLAAAVELALAREGQAVRVEADGGDAFLYIDKKVIMLSKMEEELRRIASAVAGVRGVHVRLGPDFYKKSMYRKHEPERAVKLLLVDDEREFVHTLSERLLMREIGSAVAYDGEQALAFVDEDEPDVMVLDLKMPGIDGLEVLRRVMARHPHVRVIILTGHGSREDERQCLDLGAFAYLQKPVDIDVLTDLLRQARVHGGE